MRLRNDNINLNFSKELNKSEMDDSQESSGSDFDGKVRDSVAAAAAAFLRVERRLCVPTLTLRECVDARTHM